ncbi:MAG TPA: hypothetical protein VHB98_11100, partial [Chloroflexota bacterium]|nr:hypothetical protein [Chloroflexota bacterium]
MQDYCPMLFAYQVVRQRIRELHAEAVEEVWARQVRTPGPVRCRLGRWLIALGERVGGWQLQHARTSACGARIDLPAQPAGGRIHGHP